MHDGDFHPCLDGSPTPAAGTPDADHGPSCPLKLHAPRKICCLTFMPHPLLHLLPQGLHVFPSLPEKVQQRNARAAPLNGFLPLAEIDMCLLPHLLHVHRLSQLLYLPHLPHLPTRLTQRHRFDADLRLSLPPPPASVGIGNWNPPRPALPPRRRHHHLHLNSWTAVSL